MIEQTLWLDITLDYEAELTTATDTFEHAVNYDALTRRLAPMSRNPGLSHRTAENVVATFCSSHFRLGQ